MRQFVLIAIFMFLGIVAFSQERTITGTVIDNKGEPVIGASIFVKSTSIGGVTDVNGVFTLNKVPINAILEITAIGFDKKEVSSGTETVLKVTMKDNVKSLDVVMVTGYTTQKKSDVTGAISRMTSEDIQKVPVSSIDKALQGNGSGIQVTSNSGKPGGDVMIRIRGVGTFGDAQPLFIVDGIAMDDIGSLNTRDVESMETLKDGSSTAMYGARGANGVVIITTKKGQASKDGRPIVNYETYFGYQKPWKLLDVCNATEWATLNNEANRNTYSPGASVHDPLRFSDAQIAKLGEGTNWQKELFKTAFTTSHQLGISGGSEKHQYNMSASYLNQDGIVKGSDYKKYIIRLSNTNHISTKLKVNTTFNLNHSGGNSIREQDEWTGPLITAIIAPPYYPIYNPDGSFFPDTLSTTPNNMSQTANNNNSWNGLNFQGSNEIEYKILKNLTFKNIIGTEQAFYDSYNFTPTFQLTSFKKDSLGNTYIINDPEEKSANNSLQRTQKRLNDMMFENILTWSKEISKHNILLLVGQSGERRKYPLIEISQSDFPNNDPSNRWLSLAEGKNPAVSEKVEGQSALLGYLARLEYSYNNRYLLTANIRRDGSSKFPKETRWGNFPSVTAGWKLSEESFLKKHKWIDLLKIRTGFGVVGNASIDQSSVVPRVDIKHNNYVLGTGAAENMGNAIYGFPDPTIRWERIVSTNAGLNANFFDNKIELTFDYFVKKTKDMLVQKPIAQYTGLEDKWVNLGTLENHGFEIELKYRTTINKVVDFSIAPNLTHIVNNVTYMGDDTTSAMASNKIVTNEYISYTKVGFPVASFYGYTTDGIFQTDDEIKTYINSTGDMLQGSAKVGDRKYVDINKDGKINGLDKSVIGNPWPKFFFGLNMSVSYKNWTLDMLLQGQYGNKIFNMTKYYLENGSAYVNVNSALYDNFVNPKADSIEFTGLTKTDKNSPTNFSASDWYLEDGSFLRCRNIQLLYTFPESITNKLKIQGLQLYVKAQNLFTITKYSGFDPEIGEAGDWLGGSLAVGTDRAIYPQARTLMGGLILNF